MHEVLGSDELKRIRMGIGKRFEQDPTFMTFGKRKVLSRYRLPL